MNQKQLAAALGLDEAAVSRDIRRGMPSDSVAAAARWRDLNVRPYARSTHGGTGRTGFAGADEQLARLGVVDGAVALRAANDLAALAAPLIVEGRFGEVLRPLRSALQAVPEKLRPQVRMPTPVWLELTREVRALLVPEEAAAAVTAPAAAAPSVSDMGDQVAVGAFWFQVAAGELVIDHLLAG